MKRLAQVLRFPLNLILRTWLRSLSVASHVGRGGCQFFFSAEHVGCHQRCHSWLPCFAISAGYSDCPYPPHTCVLFREAAGTAPDSSDPWTNRELFIKWKRYSYIHCSWDSRATLAQVCILMDLSSFARGTKHATWHHHKLPIEAVSPIWLHLHTTCWLLSVVALCAPPHQLSCSLFVACSWVVSSVW